MLQLFKRRASTELAVDHDDESAGTTTKTTLRITGTRFVSPNTTDKDRAVEIARQVLKYEKAGISITPTETILISRELLKALCLAETPHAP